MDTTYKLSQKYIGLGGLAIDFVRAFKGRTLISFDVSAVHNEHNPIIKLKIDFNDNSPFLLKTYNFDNKIEISEPISHVFYPDSNFHSVVYYPTIYIEYLNGLNFIYQCPVKMIKNSYYNDYSNLDIASCQFIDNTENHLFSVLDTGRGDILNIKIK
jgi:hypothetical protein